MASYTSNILPTDVAHYTLSNATIINGVLTIGAGGYARCNISTDMLAALTETFMVNMIMSPAPSNYTPGAFMRVMAKTTADVCYNYTCVPTVGTGGVYSTIIDMEAADYATMSVVITSDYDCVVTLWELCPASNGDLEVVIEGVKQSLPKLLYDRNYQPFTIGQNAAMIANITYYLQNNTDLQGHFLLSYNASLQCTLTLHFVDNDATELFSPLTYDLHAGRGTISVPHAYVNRLAGLHNTYVTAKVSAGTLTVGTCAMLFTIDGGYLAERLISLGTDVRDLAIKHTVADNNPEEVWTVGVDNNSLVVRKGPFSTGAISFEPVLTIADVLNAAIEFDGYFSIRNQIAYTIVTLAQPYIFFTDTDKTLYVQYGDDEDTRMQLDTGVEAISACRGFKATTVLNNDQGLVCVYTKTDGSVYYRYYAYNNDGYYWLGPMLLRNTAYALDVHVHRLNDYRVGIVVTTEDENIWYISDRTYVEQAVKPERAYYALTTASARLSMRDGAASDPQTLSATMSENLYVDITSNYALHFSEPIADCITLSNGTIASAVMTAPNVVRITLSEPTYVNETVTLDIYKVSFVVHNNYYTLDTVTATAIGGLKESVGQAQYALTSASSSAAMTPILRKPVNPLPEYATIDLASASSSVALSKVTYIPLTPLPEQAVYALSSASAAATLTLVGTEPI